MKVQNVEKQCTAKVGIAIEFSNSEVDSIIRLALKLNDAIEEECEKANRFVRSSELGTVYKETDEILLKLTSRWQLASTGCLTTLQCVEQVSRAICLILQMRIMRQESPTSTLGRRSNPLPFLLQIRRKSNKPFTIDCSNKTA